MDRRENLFRRGPALLSELAGRDRIIEDATVARARVKSGRPAKSQMLLGLQASGKTVLLNEIARSQRATGTARSSSRRRKIDAS